MLGIIPFVVVVNNSTALPLLILIFLISEMGKIKLNCIGLL